MLQHRVVDQQVLLQWLERYGHWNNISELEQLTNQAVAQLRRTRSQRAANSSWVRRLQVGLDALLLTDQLEYLDMPDFDPERRVGIIEGLHRFNRWVFAYQRFYRILKPLIQRRILEQGRTVRVLELASGSGAFALMLAQQAIQDGLDVEVTGSDYFPEHVEACRLKSSATGNTVQFQVLNAFDLSEVTEDAYDLVVVTQSIHHFSPGKVAMMIHQSLRVASMAFVGIDGQRSLGLYAVVPTAGVLMRAPDFIHDGVITLRKFYTETELELIGRLAARTDHVNVRTAWPGYSVLTVSASRAC